VLLMVVLALTVDVVYATDVPTLTEWALIVLAIVLLATGWLQYRRRQ